jgi:antitoxin component YwqK of YwqJK toxin-antitoxin module
MERIPPEFAVKQKMDNFLLLSFKEKEIGICWFDNGQIESIAYYTNLRLDRPYTEGPAFLSWHETGHRWEICYYENGVHHRPVTEGPADIIFYKNGRIMFETYYEYGVSIREVPHF